MARRQGKSAKETALRSLRAYALAGDLKRAEQILLRLQEEQPDDTFAAEELQRLRSGLPLRISETRQQRQLREEEEERQEVLQALEEYKEKQINWHELEAPRLALYAAIAATLPAREHLTSFRHAAETELKRRKTRRVKLTVSTAITVLLAIGLTAAAALRHTTAIAKSITLEQALRSGNWEHVQTSLRQAKHPVDRLLSMQLRNSITQAENWVEAQHTQRTELMRKLAAWQQNPRDFAGLSKIQRQQFENNLTALAYPHQDMLESWQALTGHLKQTQLEHRSSVLAILSEPLPPPPPLSSDAGTDEQALIRHRDKLLQRIHFYEEASQKHNLNAELIAPARRALQHTQEQLRDITGLKKLVSNLRQARNYAHYRTLVSEYKPTQYAPAINLMAPLSKLPPEQDLRQMVQNGSGNIAHQTLETTLLQAGPTFTAEHPATREQTAIIEKIFTSAPLHRVFYKLRNSAGETCITEKDPVVFSQTKGYRDAKIIRSTYDPAYSPTKPAGFIWTEAETIMKTTIDATPLIRAAGIERDTFFETANLPVLLDTIINTEAPYCPPLARAYLFHAILQLILKHPEPAITGINFCPTLQQDARGFLSIIRRSRRPFADGMWLQDGADIDWLNETYGRWFHDKKGTSYAREIEENVKELTRVHPRFAGHIGLRGEVNGIPRLNARLTPGTRIWYLRDTQGENSVAGRPAAVSIGTCGSALTHPLPLSPFFIEEKE